METAVGPGWRKLRPQTFITGKAGLCCVSYSRVLGLEQMGWKLPSLVNLMEAGRSQPRVCCAVKVGGSSACELVPQPVPGLGSPSAPCPAGTTCWRCGLGPSFVKW